jgi:uncharacterized RDD family membrane protein YckC
VRERATPPAIEPPIEKPIERPVSTDRKAGRDRLLDELDRPLVKLPAEPRAPLSVRRAAEQPPRKAEAESTMARPSERDLLDDLHVPEPAGPAGQGISRRPEPLAVSQPEPPAARPAGPVGRSFAALLDVVFLAGVGLAVLWITMRACGLRMADLPTLPILMTAPLATFVLLIDLGYLLLFTAAGGQTLGKMAARIRVVGTSSETGDDERLNIQRAAYRSLLTLPSVLALGAGFLPALVGDRRAVHDRLAATRVIRA